MCSVIAQLVEAGRKTGFLSNPIVSRAESLGACGLSRAAAGCLPRRACALVGVPGAQNEEERQQLGTGSSMRGTAASHRHAKHTDSDWASNRTLKLFFSITKSPLGPHPGLAPHHLQPRQSDCSRPWTPAPTMPMPAMATQTQATSRPTPPAPAASPAASSAASPCARTSSQSGEERPWPHTNSQP